MLPWGIRWGNYCILQGQGPWRSNLAPWARMWSIKVHWRLDVWQFSWPPGPRIQSSQNSEVLAPCHQWHEEFQLEDNLDVTWEGEIWANQPIHSFFVGCLNPLPPRNQCTTNVRVVPPQPKGDGSTMWKGNMTRICTLHKCTSSFVESEESQFEDSLIVTWEGDGSTMWMGKNDENMHNAQMHILFHGKWRVSIRGHLRCYTSRWWIYDVNGGQWWEYAQCTSSFMESSWENVRAWTWVSPWRGAFVGIKK